MLNLRARKIAYVIAILFVGLAVNSCGYGTWKTSDIQEITNRKIKKLEFTYDWNASTNPYEWNVICEISKSEEVSRILDLMRKIDRSKMYLGNWPTNMIAVEKLGPRHILQFGWDHNKKVIVFNEGSSAELYPIFLEHGIINPEEEAPGMPYVKSVYGWKGFEEFFAKANREGELFRWRLIDEGIESRRVRLIWEAIGRFCDESGEYLKGRSGVEGFRMEWEDFKGAILGGENLEAQEVYGGFTGRWYGLWDKMEVDHYWGKIVDYEQPKEVKIDGERSVWVRSQQYCWVGDGYGLNVIATDSPGEGDFLLGYVIHIQEGDMTKTTKERPHVGVYAGEGKVIWITEGEVFLEEPYEREDEDEYSITGFFYEVGEGVLQSKGCFQAIYTRRVDERPGWYSFPLKIEISDGK